MTRTASRLRLTSARPRIISQYIQIKLYGILEIVFLVRGLGYELYIYFKMQ